MFDPAVGPVAWIRTEAGAEAGESPTRCGARGAAGAEDADGAEFAAGAEDADGAEFAAGAVALAGVAGADGAASNGFPSAGAVGAGSGMALGRFGRSRVGVSK